MITPLSSTPYKIGKPSSAYLKISATMTSVEGNLQGFKPLSPAEQRLYTGARCVLRYDDVPEHRKEVLEKLLEVLQNDFVLTKTYMLLQSEKMI